jgi:hypothetical protein
MGRLIWRLLIRMQILGARRISFKIFHLGMALARDRFAGLALGEKRRREDWMAWVMEHGIRHANFTAEIRLEFNSFEKSQWESSCDDPYTSHTVPDSGRKQWNC